MLQQNSEMWGVGIYFIPQFFRTLQLWDSSRYGDYAKIGYMGMTAGFRKESDAAKRLWHLPGILLVSNGCYNGTFGGVDTLREITRWQEQIGWDDTVKFHGWYDSEPVFTTLAHRTVTARYLPTRPQTDGCLSP